MITLQWRRMMMAQGVTYKGIPLMITNVGDEPIEVSLRFNALRKTEPPVIYYNTTGKKSYKKWDFSNISLAKGGTLYVFGASWYESIRQLCFRRTIQGCDSIRVSR